MKVSVVLAVFMVLGEFIAFLIWMRDEKKYHDDDVD